MLAAIPAAKVSNHPESTLLYFENAFHPCHSKESNVHAHAELNQ
jgi:hypothetical protein